MEGSSNSTPMEEEVEAPEQTILWNEWAASLPPQERVYSSMVVEVTVDGEVVTVDSEGECLEGCIELSCLLGKHP